jgi:hypothetical protein
VPTPPTIRVMISSRCNDPIPFGGAPSTLSAVRLRMKQELEQVALLDSRLFDVWINEDAAPAEGTADSWDACLKQVREADIVLVLYNGSAGWAKEGGDVGICHAELQTALATGGAKIRLIQLPLHVGHAVPDALSVPAALESVGQPFLSDHQHLGFLDGARLGPVHLFVCHQGVTASQARRLLGFPDATIVQAPFGVYVADRVQKIQLVFITQCRDETSARYGVQRLFDWLDQTQEDGLLAERAAARKRIVKAIAKELQGE